MKEMPVLEYRTTSRRVQCGGSGYSEPHSCSHSQDTETQPAGLPAFNDPPEDREQSDPSANNAVINERYSDDMARSIRAWRPPGYEVSKFDVKLYDQFGETLQNAYVPPRGYESEGQRSDDYLRRRRYSVVDSVEGANEEPFRPSSPRFGWRVNVEEVHRYDSHSQYDQDFKEVLNEEVVYASNVEEVRRYDLRSQYDHNTTGVFDQEVVYTSNCEHWSSGYRDM
ncbi:hypothetical protein L202_00979 [Cryptococcus amylolentus CBS 6039]|uniref:Uncharacterized protein n=2 Tax=Cryptococcus amylolentus TaxID=104669 RepID=A0A1E3I493_9TREE|nr:hypothetical protein L202_00979 [Cryptococcus amylolentus CBS 6039]ODN82686.1 hypothetical protein L202_00979 [Cryptococcus amylolentus CBS 6039]ODO10378.1 hypothetical protein I350_00973 [Cryptococcus amylolentus CBS 6273]